MFTLKPIGRLWGLGNIACILYYNGKCFDNNFYSSLFNKGSPAYVDVGTFIIFWENSDQKQDNWFHRLTESLDRSFCKVGQLYLYYAMPPTHPAMFLLKVDTPQVASRESHRCPKFSLSHWLAMLCTFASTASFHAVYSTTNPVRSPNVRVMLVLQIALVNNVDPTGPKIAFPLPAAGGRATSLREMAPRPTGRAPPSA